MAWYGTVAQFLDPEIPIEQIINSFWLHSHHVSSLCHHFNLFQFLMQYTVYIVCLFNLLYIYWLLFPIFVLSPFHFHIFSWFVYIAFLLISLGVGSIADCPIGWLSLTVCYTTISVRFRRLHIPQTYPYVCSSLLTVSVTRKSWFRLVFKSRFLQTYPPFIEFNRMMIVAT
jgi:hypothetical protein